MGLPNSFSSILWEYDLTYLSYNDKIVTERVLSLGGKDIVKEWKKGVGENNMKDLYYKHRGGLDKKSAAYWGLIFGIKQEERILDNRSMYDKLNTPIFSRNFG